MKDGIIKAVLFVITAIIIGTVIAICYYSNRRMNSQFNEIMGGTLLTDEGKKEVEEYISKIYLNSLIVNKEDTLPEFEDINEASDDWILNCIYNNLELENGNFNFSKEEIYNVKNALFGTKLEKPLKNADKYGHIKENQDGSFNIAEVESSPAFLYYYIVDNIERSGNNIEVTLIEYKTNSLYDGSTNIKVYTRDGEEGLFMQPVTDMDEEGNSESDTKITEFIKENKDKFTKAKIILEYESADAYHIKSVKRDN